MKRKISFLLLSFMTVVAACTSAQVKNIVLVHGAWADVSGWNGVYKILVAKGYHVDVVGTANQTLTGDADAVRAVLARQTGPVILVGHSYGGAVITEAGDTSSVVGLVYVSAFAPDAGETLIGLLKSGPPNPESGILLPPVDGLIWYDVAKFHKDFCPDLPDVQAAFMASSQTPSGLATFTTPLTKAAWRGRPTWAIISTQDRMIPPDAERFMAKRANAKITEIQASHVAFISHPKEVAAVIETAATQVGH
ncbi:alpha/beta hydrolase [Flavitalea sp. BT771]|uniref:alpha/beta hydrolase n=1 Tax=Flavitalea sp. BT771 TaxID=3063329 RepID=UPI0026E2500B|nr:alpha/beta hydrolase [Flavitalea sp. BT771]MDO6430225.1 alpha/beta hydrolase [Flavitalea sp. BT771]MDV6219635.1 alpha/beta hydrolase [Flavitalea sp. BT771]